LDSSFYHAFAKSQPLISVTFSTPTGCFTNHQIQGKNRSRKWRFWSRLPHSATNENPVCKEVEMEEA
jgi:hypothetical protein